MTEPKKLLSAKAMLKMLEARVEKAERDVIDATKAYVDSLKDGANGLTQSVVDAVLSSVQKLRDAEALVATAKGGA